MIKYFSILVVLICISCKKELPENENIEPISDTTVNVIAPIVIPCEQELSRNYYETDVFLMGQNEFSMNSVSGTSIGDEYYQIDVNDFFSSTACVIEIPDIPDPNLIDKTYIISPTNLVSDLSAKISYSLGAFQPLVFIPENEDTLYVNFFDDSLYVSFCDITLFNSSTNSSFSMTGRFVVPF